MIEALKAVLFGIVEGITEWLPVSSTGHMMLLNQFLPLNVSEGFYATFLVVIQLGAIGAVILLYFNRLNPFSRRKTSGEKRATWDIWLKVVIGTIPAGIIGLAFDDLLEEKVMNNPDVAYIVVSIALIVYGVLFIILERIPNMCGCLVPRRERRAVAQFSGGAGTQPRGRHERPAVQMTGGAGVPSASTGTSKLFTAGIHEPCPDGIVESMSQMSYFKAFFIGVFQSLAVIPGTSRSGSIIIGSMLLGTSRTVAAEFAFFLAIPIMFGWSVVKLFKHGLAFTGSEWLILGVGMVTAFVVSIVVIRFLLNYIKKNDFTVFGVYRILLATFVLLYFGVIAA